MKALGEPGRLGAVKAVFMPRQRMPQVTRRSAGLARPRKAQRHKADISLRLAADQAKMPKKAGGPNVRCLTWARPRQEQAHLLG